MFPNNGENSCKRKMKEVAETALPPTQPPITFFASLPYCPLQPLGSTALRIGQNVQPEVPQKISPLPLKKSFTAFVTQHNDVRDNLSFSAKQPTGQIDALIKAHGEQMQCTLAELWARQYHEFQCAIEEREAKKQKMLEGELINMARMNAKLEEQVAYFRAQMQVWEAKAKSWEKTTLSLKAALHEANLPSVGTQMGIRLRCAGCNAAHEEDAESSFVDPERVEPVMLSCKACESSVATVMMWPCRHVSVCVRCDTICKACPVCHTPKITSVEVFLP